MYFSGALEFGECLPAAGEDERLELDGRLESNDERDRHFLEHIVRFADHGALDHAGEHG